MDGEHPALSADELDALEAQIDAAIRELSAHEVVLAVDRGEPGERRWYVRLRGEEKDVTTIWLTLRQRLLHFETYVIATPVGEGTGTDPAPLFEQVLRRNYSLQGLHFAIGPEDALYLVGAVPAVSVDAAVVDQIIGSCFAAVESCFGVLVDLAFGWALRRADGDAAP